MKMYILTWTNGIETFTEYYAEKTVAEEKLMEVRGRLSYLRLAPQYAKEIVEVTLK